MLYGRVHSSKRLSYFMRSLDASSYFTVQFGVPTLPKRRIERATHMMSERV
jgi:hypothetical protein